MIISSDEASKLYTKKINALLRMTRKPPKPTDVIELNCRIEQNGGFKVDTVARAIIKSVRPVNIGYYKANPEAVKDHGSMSINGLKRHIEAMYSPEVWADFVSGDLKLTRIKFDYTLNLKNDKDDKKSEG